MKAIKDTWRNLPLRRFFILTVAITIVAASLLSALIISGCIAFRRWLLPDSNAAYLTIEETSEGGESTTKTYRLEYGQRLSSMPSIIVDENGDPMTTEGEKQTRFSIQKVENSFDMLSPKRKFAYQVCGAMMVAAPAALAFAGICACSIYFCKRS